MGLMKLLWPSYTNRYLQPSYVCIHSLGWILGVYSMEDHFNELQQIVLGFKVVKIKMVDGVVCVFRNVMNLKSTLPQLSLRNREVW